MAKGGYIGGGTLVRTRFGRGGAVEPRSDVRPTHPDPLTVGGRELLRQFDYAARPAAPAKPVRRPSTSKAAQVSARHGERVAEAEAAFIAALASSSRLGKPIPPCPKILRSRDDDPDDLRSWLTRNGRAQKLADAGVRLEGRIVASRASYVKTCEQALSGGILTESGPNPPKLIAREVAESGGPRGWYEALRAAGPKP